MFVLIRFGVIKIDGENIENDWEVINRGVAFMEEEEVVNNGSEIIENKHFPKSGNSLSYVILHNFCLLICFVLCLFLSIVS